MDYQCGKCGASLVPFCPECEDDLHASLRTRVAELEAMLRLVLPLAKGYAHAHPVGSNQTYVNQADDLLNS